MGTFDHNDFYHPAAEGAAPGRCPRRPRPRPAHPVPPIKDPDETLGEVRALAKELLPGARIRRHPYFRYSLIHRA